MIQCLVVSALANSEVLVLGNLLVLRGGTERACDWGFYKYIKTTFDVCCLTTTIIISIFILHKAVGVGVGTVICALTTGKVVSLIQSYFDKHLKFYRYTLPTTLKYVNLGILNKLMNLH